MKQNQINKLMDVLIAISALLVLVGAILKLQHVQYGDQILWGGFMPSFILNSIEITRLKKIIKVLRKEQNQGEE